VFSQYNPRVIGQILHWNFRFFHITTICFSHASIVELNTLITEGMQIGKNMTFNMDVLFD
jgi:hypothetical protein